MAYREYNQVFTGVGIKINGILVVSGLSFGIHSMKIRYDKLYEGSIAISIDGSIQHLRPHHFVTQKDFDTVIEAIHPSNLEDPLITVISKPEENIITDVSVSTVEDIKNAELFREELNKL